MKQITQGLTYRVSKQRVEDGCVTHLETNNDNGVIVKLQLINYNNTLSL